MPKQAKAKRTGKLNRSCVVCKRRGRAVMCSFCVKHHEETKALKARAESAERRNAELLKELERLNTVNYTSSSNVIDLSDGMNEAEPQETWTWPDWQTVALIGGILIALAGYVWYCLRGLLTWAK